MIRCVHCAEEIQEEAAVFPRCGRMVPGRATTIERYGIVLGFVGLGILAIAIIAVSGWAPVYFDLIH